MRVALFAYQTWGYRVLGSLIDSRHEVVLVVTHPTSDDIYETIWTDSVEKLAEQNRVPYLVKAKPDAQVVSRLQEARADTMVACNWRTWIPPEVFTAPRLGTVNVHDSLLPKYAGFAPLNWAMINGETEVGVTSHMMDEHLDRGEIIQQWSVPVEPEDTVTNLFDKTLEIFGPLTIESLDLVETGSWEPVAQDLSQASFFHRRSMEDSRIDWSWPAGDLVNLVKAQVDPYPNAFAFYGPHRLRILKASVSPANCGGTRGRIFARQGDGVIIVCGPEPHRGTGRGLVIERVRTDDGTDMAAGEYFKRMGGYLTSHPG